MVPPKEVARLTLPTWTGEFDLRTFQGASGEVYLLLIHGEIGDGNGLLVRVHSGCLTGDALGSLRCDCGPQLHLAMRRIAAEGRTTATTRSRPTASWDCRSMAVTTAKPSRFSWPPGSAARACSPTTRPRRAR
jgi:hypothetical protein